MHVFTDRLAGVLSFKKNKSKKITHREPSLDKYPTYNNAINKSKIITFAAAFDVSMTLLGAESLAGQVALGAVLSILTNSSDLVAFLFRVDFITTYLERNKIFINILRINTNQIEKLNLLLKSKYTNYSIL